MAELIVVLGFPGAGKSTHSEHLVDTSLDGRPVAHVSVGNRMRDILANRTASQFGDTIRATSPRPLSHDVIMGALFELIPDQADAIGLIDGYPRYPDMVAPFLNYVEQSPHQLLGCLSLDLSLETSVARATERSISQIERTRTPEYHAKRYQKHARETLPAIEQLGHHTPIIHIDTNANFDAVRERFNDAVRTLVSSPPPLQIPSSQPGPVAQ